MQTIKLTTSLPGHDPSPHVLEAERFQREVLISFDSGESAFFSAALLDRTMSHAERIDGDKSIFEWE